MDKRDFFISYTEQDQAMAEWIAWTLEEAGYTTIIQAWDFRPGQNFPIEMDDACQLADRLIAVLSPAYVQSKFGKSECASFYALDGDGKRGLIVPCRITEFELKGVLRPIISVDLVGQIEDQARQRLLAGVKSGRAKPTEKPPYRIAPNDSYRAKPATKPRYLPEAVSEQQAIESDSPKPQLPSRDPRLIAYLHCIIEKYGHWEEEYTHTGAKIDLKVRKSAISEKLGAGGETEPQLRKSAESYPVLDGLEKYAVEHVLLKGVPGSGKTTALERLLLQAGRRAVEDLDARVPVFVRLRSYEDSVEGLIRDFFIQHDAGRLEDEIQDLLFDRQLFLLVDGLNELPSSDSRKDLKRFRELYASYAPMVFTTREIGIGSDLGISHTLEMEPLTEQQVKEFVRKKVPAGSERLIGQLTDRWRKLAETPLFLEMLCDVFDPNDARGLPANLALTFRKSTDDRVRERGDDPAVCLEFERYTQEFLAHVAYRMMLHEDPREMNLEINRRELEEMVEGLLKEKKHKAPQEAAESLVREWLGHHLLRITADTAPSSQHRQKIEFSHQLFQEYYAAEYLLNMIDEIESDDLARNYLNYIKCTEPIALLTGLVDEQDTAVRIVKAALDVDLFLAARLAGEAREEFHEATVGLILSLQFEEKLLVELLGVTGSPTALPMLEECLSTTNWQLSVAAILALGNIKHEDSVRILERARRNSDWSRAAERALASLGQMANDEALTSSAVHGSSRLLPGGRDSESLVEALAQLVRDGEHSDRLGALDELSWIPSTKAFEALKEATNCDDGRIRAAAIVKLGKTRFEGAIELILEASKDPDARLRRAAAIACGKTALKEVDGIILQLLDDWVGMVRWAAAQVSPSFPSEAVIQKLLVIVLDNNEDEDIRSAAAEALGEIGEEVAIDPLIRLLHDESPLLRRSAAVALGKVNTTSPGICVAALTQVLQDPDPEGWVRRSASEALGDIGAEECISPLRKALKDPEADVRWQAAQSLSRIGSEAAVSVLADGFMQDRDLFYIFHLQRAQQKLKIYNPTLLPKANAD